MNFFILAKNDLSFPTALDFCVFVKSRDFKICDMIIGIAIYWKWHLYLFLLNSKYYHILVCCLTNISNMFFAQCWRLEISSTPFYDFIKMTIKQGLAIFRSSRPNVFYKKGALRNSAKFTGKHLCHSLFFNKVAGLRRKTLFKKWLWHRCFPVNFFKISKSTFSHRKPAVLHF